MNLKNLLSFFESEQKATGKSKAFLAKLYTNRVKQNLDGDREVVIFLFDKIGELYFKGKATPASVAKLTYGFELLVGKKDVWAGLSNYLEFKKAEINKIKAENA